MAYSYEEKVTRDVVDWLNNDIDESDLEELKEMNFDERCEWLHDTLWAEDSVTGNGTDGYDSADKLFDYIRDDKEYVEDALGEFDYDGQGMFNAFKDRGIDGLIEYLDVTARCYALDGAIREALEEVGLGEKD